MNLPSPAAIKNSALYLFDALNPRPIATHRFAVDFGVFYKMSSWCTSVDGLSVKRETISQAEGGVNNYTHKLAGRFTQSTITFKRLMGLSTYFWDVLHEGQYSGGVTRMDITITLFSDNGAPTKMWHLYDAFISGWTGPSLSTEGNEVAFETLTVEYHTLEEVYSGLLQVAQVATMVATTGAAIGISAINDFGEDEIEEEEYEYEEEDDDDDDDEEEVEITEEEEEEDIDYD